MFLEQYLKRINYAGSPTVSLETLNVITKAHVKAIPFENIDVVLGRGIELSDDRIFEKLVTHERGGYCFEQNTLLLNVLTEIGFSVKPISGRVRLRFTSRDEVAPLTHIFLRVDLEGVTYVTDVGMGGASLTQALELKEGVEQQTSHDLRRLDKVGSIWYHQIKFIDGWRDACEFTLEEMPAIDREIANWYTSAHPQSHFRDRIVAARAIDQGQRLTLQNFEFTIRESSGESQTRILQANAELVQVLSNDFGLKLSADDQEKLLAIKL